MSRWKRREPIEEAARLRRPSKHGQHAFAVAQQGNCIGGPSITDWNSNGGTGLARLHGATLEWGRLLEQTLATAGTSQTGPTRSRALWTKQSERKVVNASR